MDKATLRNYRAMELELTQLEELIARVEARIVEPKTAKLSAMPKGKGLASDSVSANIAQLEALRELYNERWDRIIDSRKEIENAIDGLEPIERTIMRYRYIDGLSWNQTAKKMGYSSQHIKNKHGRAIKKLTKQ